jgi:hypothetical protein
MVAGKDSVTRILEILTGFLGFAAGIGFLVDMIPSVKYDMDTGIYGALGVVVGALVTVSNARRKEGKSEQTD